MAGLAGKIPEELFTPACRFLEPAPEDESLPEHCVERYWRLTGSPATIEIAFEALNDAARVVQRNWARHQAAKLEAARPGPGQRAGRRGGAGD